MTNYASGRAIEYRVVNMLRGWGYESVRSAGSHGAWDVVAFNWNNGMLVQCKTFTGETPPSFNLDIAKLDAVPTPPGIQKWLAVWRHGKGWYTWIDAKTGKTVNFSSKLTPKPEA